MGDAEPHAMKNLGFIIKCVRKFHLENARTLALKAGISPSYLSEIEAGKKMPSVEILDKIANHYKMFAWSFLRLAQAYEMDIGLVSDAGKTELIHQWLKEMKR